MGSALLTVPDVIENSQIFYPVGNEWVSLPEITSDGAIHSLNLLSRAHKGMIEFRGGKLPLIAPLMEVDGSPLNTAGLVWNRLDDWIPRFRVELPDIIPGIVLQGTIFSPNGYKGFVYVLQAKNGSSEKRECRLGWTGDWRDTVFTVYRSRPSSGLNAGWYNSWTRTLTFEHRAGMPVAAWAVGLCCPLSGANWQIGDNGNAGVQSSSGESIPFRVHKDFELEPGSSVELALFAGVNSEADGASTCVVDLQRHGWRDLLAGHTQWIRKHLLISGPNPSRAARLCNLNAFYNYFFARGRCIDTGDWVLMTSRSPRYYVSAAFWARDAYLWSFPGLLAMDVEAARQALMLWRPRSNKWRRSNAQNRRTPGSPRLILLILMKGAFHK